MQYVVDHSHDSQQMQGDSSSCDKWRLERSIMNSALQYNVILELQETFSVVASLYQFEREWSYCNWIKKWQH